MRSCKERQDCWLRIRRAEMAQQILARCEAMMRGQVNEPGRRPGEMSDPLFLDLLRVVQLALIRGELQPADVPSLSGQLVREYPTRDAMLNRELVRLLAYLQPPEAPARLPSNCKAKSQRSKSCTSPATRLA